VRYLVGSCVRWFIGMLPDRPIVLYRLKYEVPLWRGLTYLSRYNSGWFCHISYFCKQIPRTPPSSSSSSALLCSSASSAAGAEHPPVAAVERPGGHLLPASFSTRRAIAPTALYSSRWSLHPSATRPENHRRPPPCRRRGWLAAAPRSPILRAH
jgi:hypothetical protein